MSSSPGEQQVQAGRRQAWSPMLPLDARPPARPSAGAADGPAVFGRPGGPLAPVAPPRAGFGPAPGRNPLAGADDTVHLSSAQDTLQVIANADRWAQLTNALDEALVPLAVGDVDALRHLAKLEQPVLDALTRWIGAANRGHGGWPARPAGSLPA
ncbi:hypothetical protein OG689_33920 [Kitasatospora sp. NBC_00240]|uniref:hypothetical protein n=1 Tax=Kitasatospora sp. NBC_00240 TaxID=2903567 RepID=UPI002256D48D|nr:hypothetical protein [Kitasatospora sp. NBC_00240]MCX5214203.1 hypothetical protein [Kitasatospora sp. NBC_00240]